MSCWCDEVDYTCLDCEHSTEWDKYTQLQKIKTMAWQKIIESGFDVTNPQHTNLQKFIISNNLNIALIPNLP